MAFFAQDLDATWGPVVWNVMIIPRSVPVSGVRLKPQGVKIME